MKLISLNIWGRRIREPLLEFISKNQETEFFCFQEIYHNASEAFAQTEIKATLDIFSKIENVLPNHVGYFRPIVAGTYGIGIFVKKGIEVIEEGEVAIHENKNFSGYGGDHSRNLEWMICKGKGNKFADYVFVSPDVDVKDFRVLPDEVSDHAALELEF